MHVLQVESFSYSVTSDGKCDKEISRRIGMAKTIFHSMSNVLLNKRVKVVTGIMVLQCYVWSVLLYGCEAWTVSKTSKRNGRHQSCGY